MSSLARLAKSWAKNNCFWQKMKTTMLWLLEGIIYLVLEATWFQRQHWEYDTLSLHWECHTLSTACWEHDTLSAVVVAAVTILPVTVNVSIAVAVVIAVIVATTNVKSIAGATVAFAAAIICSFSAAAVSWLLLSVARWEYDTLSARWEYHTLSGWHWEYDALSARWKYVTLSAAMDACRAAQEARRIEARAASTTLATFSAAAFSGLLFFSPLLLSLLPPPLLLLMLLLLLSPSPLSPSPLALLLLSSLQSM
jgi:hypothetical protein